MKNKLFSVGIVFGALVLGFSVGNFFPWNNDRVPYVIPDHNHGDKILRIDCPTCATIIKTAGGSLETVAQNLSKRLMDLESRLPKGPPVIEQTEEK